MKISNIAHIGIDVEDMEASLKFYCDGLGMKKKFVLYYDELQTKKSLPWLIYLELAEHQYIELFYCYDGRKQHMNLRDYYSMHHMSFEVDDIHKAYQELKEKGFQPTSEIRLGPDHTYQFWIKDPDGNEIELMEYTENSLQIKELETNS